MLQKREQLIRALGNSPEGNISIVFLDAEDDSQYYTEYNRDTLPTFTQLPRIASAYMRAYGSVPEDTFHVGISARQIRARDARQRCNTLFVTEQALGLSVVTDSRGVQKPLTLCPQDHIRQIDHLIETAQEPHIKLCVLPRHTPRPDFKSVIRLDFPDGTSKITHEQEGVLAPFVTEPRTLEQYGIGLMLLAEMALDQTASLNLLRQAHHTLKA